MSAVASIGFAAAGSESFMPSIAQSVGAPDTHDWRSDRAPVGDRARAAAVWAFKAMVARSAGYTPTYAAATLPAKAVKVCPAMRAFVSQAARGAQVSAATQDMVARLKAKGMPIAAIADVLDVERKTVYSWLDDGIEAKAVNYDRLRLVTNLLAEEVEGSLRFFHRFWERMLPGGSSLKEVLMAAEIDSEAVRAALAALRPAVTRSMQTDAKRKATAAEQSLASGLTIHLLAGRRD